MITSLQFDQSAITPSWVKGGGPISPPLPSLTLVPVRRYTVAAPSDLAGPMPPLPGFPNVGPLQSQVMCVDFGLYLPAGLVLVGTPSVSLTTSAGYDPQPQSRVRVLPVVGVAPYLVGGSGVPGAAILWMVGGCLPGVSYVADVSCQDSSGASVEASTRFTCEFPS